MEQHLEGWAGVVDQILQDCTAAPVIQGHVCCTVSLKYRRLLPRCSCCPRGGRGSSRCAVRVCPCGQNMLAIGRFKLLQRQARPAHRRVREGRRTATAARTLPFYARHPRRGHGAHGTRIRAGRMPRIDAISEGGLMPAGSWRERPREPAQRW